MISITINTTYINSVGILRMEMPNNHRIKITTIKVFIKSEFIYLNNHTTRITIIIVFNNPDDTIPNNHRINITINNIINKSIFLFTLNTSRKLSFPKARYL